MTDYSTPPNSILAAAESKATERRLRADRDSLRAELDHQRLLIEKLLFTAVTIAGMGIGSMGTHIVEEACRKALGGPSKQVTNQELASRFPAERHRMLTAALEFLDREESSWGLMEPIDREGYLRSLVEHAGKGS